MIRHTEFSENVKLRKDVLKVKEIQKKKWNSRFLYENVRQASESNSCSYTAIHLLHEKSVRLIILRPCWQINPRFCVCQLGFHLIAEKILSPTIISQIRLEN